MCTNPDCPGKKSGDRPFLFIHRDVFTKVGPGGKVVNIEMPPGEDPAKFITSRGGFLAPTCPACWEVRKGRSETPPQKQQFINWAQLYILPETAKRMKELEQEYQMRSAQNGPTVVACAWESSMSEVQASLLAACMGMPASKSSAVTASADAMFLRPEDKQPGAVFMWLRHFSLSFLDSGLHMRNPGTVEFNNVQFHIRRARLGEREFGDPTMPNERITRIVVEDEVPQAVNDRLAMVNVEGLDDVRIGADHRVGSAVDQFPRENLLPFLGGLVAFVAPVEHGDDEVGMVNVTGGLDVGQDLFLGEPCQPATIFAGLERAGWIAVVTQQSDTATVPRKNEGAMGLGQVLAAAEIGEATAVRRSISSARPSGP